MGASESGDLIPQGQAQKPIEPEIVSDDECAGDCGDGGPSDARVLFGALFSIAASAGEAKARSDELSREERRREEEWLRQQAKGDEIARRATELLALSEEEGNALLERRFAEHHFETVAGVFAALTAMLEDEKLPDGTSLVRDPQLFIITAIGRTGKRMRFVLDGETMQYQLQKNP